MSEKETKPENPILDEWKPGEPFSKFLRFYKLMTVLDERNSGSKPFGKIKRMKKKLINRQEQHYQPPKPPAPKG